jgi:DNA-binding CsgD family transcriptional regulator
MIIDMIRSDGGMCRILQESLVLRCDASVLVLIPDVTNIKRDAFQHLRLTNGKENLVYSINNVTGACQPLEGLSRREMEIGRLMGQYLTSEEIAQKLHLSLHTVNTHHYNMLRKFEMTDTKELINFMHLYRLI